MNKVCFWNKQIQFEVRCISFLFFLQLFQNIDIGMLRAYSEPKRQIILQEKFIFPTTKLKNVCNVIKQINLKSGA